MRKIAANYIFLPEHELVKNGYVKLETTQKVQIIDTGGKIKDEAGLEFYGGMLVPDYVCQYQSLFKRDEKMIPVLDQIFAEHRQDYAKLAIIEGADLIHLEWTEKAVIHILR